MSNPTLVTRITCAVFGAVGGFVLGAVAAILVWLLSSGNWDPTQFWALTLGATVVLAMLAFVFARTAEPVVKFMLDLFSLV